MIKKMTLATTLLLSSALYANQETSLGLDMDGKYQRQDYAQDASDNYRLALQPWWSYGNWLAYGELPFEARESTSSSSQTVYARTSTGRIIRRIAPQTVTTSKIQQQEGIADASLGLSYGFFREAWQHSVALDYKFANGDAAVGLGSDSTETALSWSSTYSWHKLKLNAQVGQVWIGGNNPYKNKDYVFVSSSGKWQLQPTIDVALLYSTQSELYAAAPNQDYMQVRFDWRANSLIKVYLSHGQYLQNAPSLPKQEVSIGIKMLSK